MFILTQVSIPDVFLSVVVPDLVSARDTASENRLLAGQGL
jgi:hypothetical protein